MPLSEQPADKPVAGGGGGDIFLIVDWCGRAQLTAGGCNAWASGPGIYKDGRLGKQAWSPLQFPSWLSSVDYDLNM